MINFRHYINRAKELPPHIVMRKGFNLLGRAVTNEGQRIRDVFASSFGPPIRGEFNFSIGLNKAQFKGEFYKDLQTLTDAYLRHEFDILGSGYTDAGYGSVVGGINGIKIELPTNFENIINSGKYWELLGQANRNEAKSIFGLIREKAYNAIDWQRDIRSGYRWSARTCWRDLRIGRDLGVDIKLPWELSRMQHLPQLACAAVSSNEQKQNFLEPNTYVGEIRNQILDFIANNPPRFGACWGCPMDVGIRAANWVLACGILKGAGFKIDAPFTSRLLGSLHDHAVFIASNLEWSEQGRSNHYLSDLVGLLFAAAVLPRTEETKTWLNFASHELVDETLIQFHSDGGNYEGSTSYHRLSGELITYSVALILGLIETEPSVFTCWDESVIGKMRWQGAKPVTAISNKLRALEDRLSSILEFSRAIRRPDGDIIQIGDTDSGQLFKLAPTIQDGKENNLQINELITALETLLAQQHECSASIVRQVIDSLSKGRTLNSKPRPSFSQQKIEQSLPARLLEGIEKLPNAARKHWTFPLKGSRGAGPELLSFPKFGLYVLRAPHFFLSFRCAPHARLDAPSGHCHDDNLGIELIINNEDIIRDPGTYVYTSFPEFRNSYRSAGSHFAPRAHEFKVAELTPYLFQMKQLMKGEALVITAYLLAGKLEAPCGAIYRIIEITKEAVKITDAVEGGTLRPPSKPVDIALGYGKKTSRPAYTL